MNGDADVMTRRGRRGRRVAAMALLLALAPGAPASPPRGVAEVDEMLSRLGEVGLRIDTATAARREAQRPIFSRPEPGGVELAAIAEAWIETDASAEERLLRLERIERLVESMSAEEREFLRFAVATGRYLAAAAGADRWRSGVDAPRTPAALAEAFSAAAESFLRLAARAERDRAAMGSLLLRANGLEADLLSEAQERLEARALRASFLAGWSVLQRALLLGDPAAAADAAEILEPLLDAGTSEPTPADVSMDRRSDLGFAQTVLGMAIARGLVRGGDDGLRWLELLEVESVDPALRASLPVWALLMRTAGNEPAAARRLVESWRRRSDSEAAWYGVALLEALRRGESASEDATRTMDWELLARSAASGLVDAGRHDRLRTLADGARSSGAWRPEGALGAVLDALRARERAGDTDRVEAARSMLAAAKAWPSEAAELRVDAIVGLLDAGAAPEAWAALEDAVGSFSVASPAVREQAAWLRLVAIDRLRASGRLEAAGLTDSDWALEATAFLESHPESDRAAVVAVRLGGAGLPLGQLVELAAEGDLGTRRIVRSTIARRLATAPADLRPEILDAWRRLGPLEFERDPRNAGDPGSRREAYEAIAVLVGGGEEDLARAVRLLGQLDPDAPGSDLDERALARGLEAEVALASGDPARAAQARRAALGVEADRRLGGSEVANIASATAWMQRVEFGWSRSREAAARSRDLAEAWASLAIEAANELLGSESSEDMPAEVLVRAAALATAGEAESYALRGDRRPEAAEAWRSAARRFADRAEDAAAAGWLGAAIEAVADSAAAAERWREVLVASRRLLAGRERGSEGWRHAKALQIEALSRIDPEEARAVLEQHQVLDPEWDRGAVGVRLRMLEERLPETAP